jgi:transketolase
LDLHVLEVDGHNIRAFVDAIREAQSEWRRTSVIIAYTIPGKGVSFMEKNLNGTANHQTKKKQKKHWKN